MNGRTQFAVAWMVILYFCSWYLSLAHLFDLHFWDAKYAVHQIHTRSNELYNSTAFKEIAESYYRPRRYHFLLPHVIGAVFWWNFYFLQLIPKVRHAYNKKFHRILGRCLMVCAFLQTASGVGLALTSHSKVILIISVVLAVAVFYCLFHSWRNAIARDIPKHKFWVLRLVGYLQTIALQRFWIFTLILTHQLGWYGLYPDLGENPSLDEANRVIFDMFDHSFILSILTAFLGTEWYLAGEQGMLEPPEKSGKNYEQQGTAGNIQPNENMPLLTLSSVAFHH